jgi:hypothetical protein
VPVKVKLPKNVAEAIEQVRLSYKSGCEYDLLFLNRERYGKMEEIGLYVYESRENMMRYFQALVNGYEVEETPEDKVREYFGLYSGNFRDSHEHRHALGVTQGVRETLNILNIKIDGVNA